MSDEPKSKAVATNSALAEIFGPPPVLSTENVEAYNAMLAYCSNSVKPRDFIEQMLIRDTVDASWEIRRYLMHKNWGIERKFRDRIKYEAKRETESAGRKRQLFAGQPEQEPRESPELERVFELECDIDGSIEDIDRISQKPDELDHARALENAIEFHEKLDKLHNAAVARRDNALEQLERYRNGLGQCLRRVSEEIIDAEFSDAKTDAEEHPIVPSIEGDNHQ
jgi:hypothetical protein